jgi:hypothetical protein
MELQIELEREPSKALYQLSDGEIVGAFRDAEALLASHGIDREATAIALGLSPITLKAYSRGVSTVSHRRIPAITLDRIRDLAVAAYWCAAAYPYRVEKAGTEERSYIVPTWHAHDDTGLVRDRHPHPLRIREVADKLGGHVSIAWSVDTPRPKPELLDSMASLRSRWRVGAWQIYGAFDDPEDAAELLCQIADCCRYSLWSFSTEYRPWMTQVTTSQVDRLEAAIADLERGDGIQPWESAVAKAMADLEDL